MANLYLLSYGHHWTTTRVKINLMKVVFYLERERREERTEKVGERLLYHREVWRNLCLLNVYREGKGEAGSRGVWVLNVVIE